MFGRPGSSISAISTTGKIVMQASCPGWKTSMSKHGKFFEKISVEARGQLSVQLAWARPAVFGIEELGNRLKGTEDAIDKKQKKRAAWAREQIAAIATEQEKKAADERAAVTATAASPPDDKRKENGKRKRSGEDDEARSVSKKTRKGAEEQN
ncbi:hypothetical protein NHJ13051_004753 [Beauveria bassiana]